MSKFVSALQGEAYTGSVSVSDAGLRGMITLRGDLSAADLRNAATGITGVDFPGIREANCVGERGICWMSPDELLLLTPYSEAENDVSVISRALAGQHHLVANLSDARALIVVEGAGVRDIMAKLTPVDLHPDRFQPGQFRRTRLAQVPAAFWMRDETTFEVICFRSVADYVFGILKNAAVKGTEPGYF